MSTSHYSPPCSSAAIRDQAEERSSVRKFGRLTHKAFNAGKKTLAFIIADEVHFCPLIAQPVVGSKISIPFELDEEVDAFVELIKG